MGCPHHFGGAVVALLPPSSLSPATLDLPGRNDPTSQSAAGIERQHPATIIKSVNEEKRHRNALSLTAVLNGESKRVDNSRRAEIVFFMFFDNPAIFCTFIIF